MEKIKVKCPNCRSKLSLTNSPGIINKMLTCPICSFRAKVSVFQQQATTKAEAPIDLGEEDTDPTEISLGKMDRTIGSLFFENQEFSLHKGQNTIGRRAKTGHAEIQISSDRYMSRQHAVITIKEGGSGLEHHLQPTNPKNPIKINGKVLQNADVVILQWGDRLTFGHTELLFERPNLEDDQTLLD